MRAKGTIGVGVSALAAAGLTSYLAMRRAVPSWSGVVRGAQGLAEHVDVVRDRFGVPALYGSSDADVIFAQGYCHAADRLFQMDLFRRIAAGRLAEVVGNPGVGTDKLMRTLGFAQSAAAEYELLNQETRELLASYCAGVNHRIATVGRKLPVEFRLLRYRPEPWREADTLSLSRLLMFGLCGNWEAELTRLEIAQTLGAEALACVDGDAHARPFPAELGDDVAGKLAGALRTATEIVGGGPGAGSNNWVIGPRRTESSGAILANDPHLDLSMPSNWYENVLESPTMHVRGFSIPGAPGVILGHNARIAWAFTNSCADVQDLYIEKLSADGREYADVDDAKALAVRTETIKVKGGDDISLRVRSTRRGPLISDVVSATGTAAALSLRWDAAGPSRLLDGVFDLIRAGNWTEFRSALSLWRAPSQNVLYADVDGNIGYQMSGEVPIRRKANGTLPLAGDDPSGEWIGVVPYDEMPRAFNPERGRLVTANDRIVDDDFPHFISCEWMNGYRAQRIRELVDEADYHTVDRQTGIQTDVRSLPGIELARLVRELVPKPKTAAGARMAEALGRWDGDLTVGNAGGNAYRAVLRALQAQVYGFLGELRDPFLGISRTGRGGYWSLHARSTPRILGDMSTGNTALLALGQRIYDEQHAFAHADDRDRALDGWKPEGDWTATLASALDAAAGAGVEPAGGADNPADAGRRRRENKRRRRNMLRFQHPLGVLAPLAPFVNKGPYEVPGDTDTVWQAASFQNADNDAAMVGPSFRAVWDLADFDRSVAVLAGGQSGHFASPHYADQIPLWRNGDVRPAPFSRDAVALAARYRQRLEP